MPLVMSDAERVNLAIRRVTKGWTQNTYARTRDGREVDNDDPEAVKWCMVGALGLMVPSFALSQTLRTCISKEFPKEKGRSAVSFNDTEGRKKADVLKVLRCAKDKYTAKPKRKRVARAK